MPSDQLDGDFRIEVLAREDVEVDVPTRVVEVSRDCRGLDELHQRVPGSLGQVRCKVL